MDLIKTAITEMNAPFAFVCLIVFGGSLIFLTAMKVIRNIEREKERRHDVQTQELRLQNAKLIEKKTANFVGD